VKHGPYACLGFPASSQVTTDSLIAGLLAFTVAGQEEFPPQQNQSRSESFNDGDAIGVSVSHSVRGFQGGIPEAGNQFVATANVGIAVYCRTFPLGEIKYYASVSLYSAARFFFESLGFTTTGQWNRSYYGELEIPASCILSPDRSCTPFSQQAAHIATPLTITLNGDGTCSLGNLTLTGDGGSEGLPPEFPYAKDAVDAILDGISYTFRITSRPNCLPPKDCDCEAAEGTQWTFSDGTRTKTFFYQQQGEEWGESEPYWWYWSGFQLVYQTYDPDTYVTGVGGLMLTRHAVLPICDVIDGVPTWIVIVIAQCVRYNNVPQITHNTIDEWDATLQCIEGCEDEYRSAGEPVLSGELVDVEYIGRTTAAGTTECSPPARLGISVQQIATC
jgi:hypothetical protein